MFVYDLGIDMTLSELIVILNKLSSDYPLDTPVWLSKDAEGNRFRELFDVTVECMEDEEPCPPEEGGEETIVLWPD